MTVVVRTSGYKCGHKVRVVQSMYVMTIPDFVIFLATLACTIPSLADRAAHLEYQ